MKIIRFYGENVKRLRAVEIRPDGNLVQVTGRNGQGKTSILDAIAWALQHASHSQSVPIRKGETKAKVVLDIGENGVAELVVERRFTESGSYLEVKNAEGFKAGSPQAILDKLVGAIAMDPVGFLREKPAAQVEILRNLVGLDFSAVDAERKRLYDERTLVNRDGKNKADEAAGIQMAAEQPYEAVDVEELLAELQDAEAENKACGERERKLEQAKDVAAGWSSEARDLEEKLKELQAELAEAREKAASTASDAAALEMAGTGERVDLAPIRARLTAANETNVKAAAWAEKKRQHDRLSGEVDRLRAQSASLTERMEAIDRKKEETITASAMPVPGLGFGDGCVTFDGLPLDQASDAQQLEISMAIAAAANPKLRVLRIRDGSLLDDDALARVAAWAEAQDMQVWMEIVQSDSPTAVWIEDGQVLSAEEPQPEPVAAE